MSIRIDADRTTVASSSSSSVSQRPDRSILSTSASSTYGWQEEAQQWTTLLLVVFVSFSAGIVTTTAIRQYYGYLHHHHHHDTRHSQANPNDGNDGPPSGGRGAGQDVMTTSTADTSNLPNNTDPPITVPPVSKPPPCKARWPWDRLKRRQYSSSSSSSSPVAVVDHPDEDVSTHPSVSDNHSDHSVPNDSNGYTSNNNNSNNDDDEEENLRKDQKLCCIGNIFGLDVGGTLAKLCFFESARSISLDENDDEEVEDNVNDRNSHTTSPRMGRTESSRRRRKQRSRSMSGRIRYSQHQSTGTTTEGKEPMYSSSSGRNRFVRHSWVDNHRDDDVGAATNHHMVHDRKQDNSNNLNVPTSSSSVRRVRSMLNMASSFPLNGDSVDSCTGDDHAMALNRFYNFARRLDMYEDGVRDHKLTFYSKELDGSFHFIRFETRRMKNAMELIRAHKLHHNIHEMGGTGGGAHKFAALWQQELGITMKKQDELDSLVAGMQFVLGTVVGECYTFRPNTENEDKTKTRNDLADKSREHQNRYGNYFGLDDVEESDDEDHISVPMDADTAPNADTDNGAQMNDDTTNHPSVDEKDRAQGDEWWWSRKVQRDSISSDSSTYPYLVVTIGTGVSILRVDGPRKFERVSGSTIGGGTYLGLIRLLTDVEDFDDVMRLAECGDPSKVDMMVGDIYGENSDALEKLGLPSNLVASSFGKLVTKDDPAAGLKQEDLARALLLMITNNIGQVAYLNAKIFQTPRIYFVGNFLRHNNISLRRLSYAISYWSKGEMEALFLEHEGYFGAMGAFLLAQEISITDVAERRYIYHPVTTNQTRASKKKGDDTATSLKSDSTHRRSATISHFDIARS
jgi:pantothenate kinase